MPQKPRRSRPPLNEQKNFSGTICGVENLPRRSVKVELYTRLSGALVHNESRGPPVSRQRAAPLGQFLFDAAERA